MISIVTHGTCFKSRGIHSKCDNKGKKERDIVSRRREESHPNLPKLHSSSIGG